MQTTMRAAKESIVVKAVDTAVVKRLAAELGVSTALATIFAVRGFKTADECRKFSAPQQEHFHDPFLFKHMEKACDRICAALRDREKIVIYGDYDVDGVTSTAMLLRLLRQFGASCDYYLPNRLTEGYGLSLDGVRLLAGQGATLMITVDCGITACEEVALAKSLCMDVIVTDHHEPKNELPAAFALLDPKLPSCGYPDDGLAGVGVALKLAQGLAKRIGGGDELWSRYLDLAAVGTAADIVPLVGENRIIASIGFGQLPYTKNQGLRALLSAQGCDGASISTGDVVFRIAPCINAVGRLGDPRRGVELLLTDDPALARLYAAELKEANIERRALDNHIQDEAFSWVEENCDADRDYGIVAGSRQWHCGVVGIVASKLVERYHRPSILFAIGENGLARGSGRSIAGFHLHDALTECSGLLEGFGGHAAAAGMTIKEENLAAFRSRFNEIAHKKIAPEDLVPKVTADAVVRLAELTQEFYSGITAMEPFGPGNMRPVLVCRDLKNRFDPRVVGEKHLKLMVQDGGISMDAIAFNFGDRKNELGRAGAYTLAFCLDENEWNGRKSLQLRVKGVEL
ncbi:MAG TPA: single-stranded-DNA-specific exonuclease RecJ [Chitinivibrionales bacterium]|nr:single-stranded-DNA-specific exonuclease RecJ [Chitinivibrionales bacterium]